MGYKVIQMYVDGLWIQHPHKKEPADFEPLLLDIQSRTGLPISLDGIYRWVVFVGSRQNKKRPVANRYFGVFQDGTIKVRGIEARRRDSTPFVAEAQRHLLDLLASHQDPKNALPEAVAFLRQRLRDLRSGRVKPKELLVRQRLGRKLSAYRSPSPAARAVIQLRRAGKDMRPGQRVPFLYTLGRPGVMAWDLPQKPNRQTIDVARYQKLLIRAAAIVLEAWGYDEKRLTQKMLSDLRQLGLPIPPKQHPRKHRRDIPGVVHPPMNRTFER
jgi:DNA polymerase-2